MKILHVTNYYMEGFGYQENWLPFHQKKLGHDVRILTSDRWFPLPDYDTLFLPKYGSRIRQYGICNDKGVPIIRMEPFFEIESRAVTVFPVAEYLKEFRPDVVHLHGATNFNIFSIFRQSKKNGPDIFVDCHQDHLVTREKSIANRINYAFWRGVYKLSTNRIKKFLPISKASLDFLERNLGVQSERCEISPLGVDLDDKSYSSRASDIFRNQHKLLGYKILINAGKQYAEKEILFILNVYKSMLSRAAGAKLALVLVGEAVGEYDIQIRKKIDEVNSIYEESRIVRLPFLPNKKLNGVYSAADMGIWPGVASNTIQEAMACDVIVSVLDSGATSHLIVSDSLRIPELSVDKVANRLFEALFDRESFENLKQRTAKRVRTFDWASIARHTLRIYRGHYSKGAQVDRA